MSGITLLQAQAQLDSWMAASMAVATNQSYSIAGRSLTRVNASEILNQIKHWNNLVKMLSASNSGRSRTRYVVTE